MQVGFQVERVITVRAAECHTTNSKPSQQRIQLHAVNQRFPNAFLGFISKFGARRTRSFGRQVSSLNLDQDGLAALHGSDDGRRNRVRRLVGTGMVALEALDSHGGWPPPHYAFCKGNLDVVEYLVNEVQDDVEQQAVTFGFTALHVECYLEEVLVLRFLVETGGANIEAQTTYGGPMASRQGLDKRLSCMLSNSDKQTSMRKEVATLRWS